MISAPELNREIAMNKHTPGPWVVDIERGPSRGRKKGPDTMLMVVAEKGGMPGLIVNQPPIVTDADRANARLIAAAPDLLKALQDIEHCANTAHVRYAGQTSVERMTELAIAAIKKATGE